MTNEPLYDVIAVETDAERLMAQNKDRRNAEAIMNFAVMRRGVEGEYFKVVRHPHICKSS